MGPGSSESRHQGQLGEKSAEKGLVVWEESAEVSGPRRRAWRKLPRLAMTRSVLEIPSTPCWDFQDGRTSELSGHVCSPLWRPEFPKTLHRQRRKSTVSQLVNGWAAQDWEQTDHREGKTCSHGRSFTTFVRGETPPIRSVRVVSLAALMVFS